MMKPILFISIFTLSTPFAFAKRPCTDSEKSRFTDYADKSCGNRGMSVKAGSFSCEANGGGFATSWDCVTKAGLIVHEVYDGLKQMGGHGFKAVEKKR